MRWNCKVSTRGVTIQRPYPVCDLSVANSTVVKRRRLCRALQACIVCHDKHRPSCPSMLNAQMTPEARAKPVHYSAALSHPHDAHALSHSSVLDIAKTLPRLDTDSASWDKSGGDPKLRRSNHAYICPNQSTRMNCVIKQTRFSRIHGL